MTSETETVSYNDTIREYLKQGFLVRCAIPNHFGIIQESLEDGFLLAPYNGPKRNITFNNYSHLYIDVDEEYSNLTITDECE